MDKMKYKISNNIAFKILFIIIISILLIFQTILPVCAIVSPKDNFYVNDYANILSDETEQYIIQKSNELYNVDGTQVVVVTVPNLEGDYLEHYANQYFNTYGIGDKNKDNGLLLLLTLEERQFRVEVGDGFEGILPDGKTGEFQDKYIIPYLKNNEWDKGVLNGYKAFINEIIAKNNLNIVSSTPDDTPIGTPYEPSNDLSGKTMLIVIASGLIVGLILKKTRIKYITPIIAVTCIVILIYSMITSKDNLTITSILFGMFFSATRIRSGTYVYKNGEWIRIGNASSSSYRGHSSSSSHSSGGGGHSSGGGSSRSF